MTSSENDDLKEVQKKADTYEDEINLIDYFECRFIFVYPGSQHNLC
mgnify:CR=1 FL=1